MRYSRIVLLVIAVLLLALAADIDGDTEPTHASHSTVDTDGDGVADVDEGPCGGDAGNASKKPERLDLVGDEDMDGSFNEALPSPASDAYDCDGDGWTGTQEMAIFASGTTANDQDPCGNDGWPADLWNNGDGKHNIADWNSFIAPFGVDDGHGPLAYWGHTVPDAGRVNEQRWNLVLDGIIDVADLNTMNPGTNAPTARPPMLGGWTIWGATCDTPFYAAPAAQTAHSTAALDNLSLDMDPTGNGTPAAGANPWPEAEGSLTTNCDTYDSDLDGTVDDGCLGGPAAVGGPEGGVCGNGLDDDQADLDLSGIIGDAGGEIDGVADDGCVVTLGARQDCVEIIDDGVLNGGEDAIVSGQDRAFIDVTVGAQPGPDGGIPGARPMTAFQFSLNWSGDAIDVRLRNPDFLLASGGAGPPWSVASDPFPDPSSPYTVALMDGGPAETGAGVLARITIEGNTAGLANLSLTAKTIRDGLNEGISIAAVNNARVAVSKDLDGDGELEIPGDLGQELFNCGADGDGDGVHDESEGECGDDLDNNGDTLVNEGCPQVGATAESGSECTEVPGTAVDDDSDSWVNDGCPGSSETNGCGAKTGTAASRPERIDLSGDDDGDGDFNEALPGGSSGLDCDGDGWTGAEEMAIYAAGSTTNDQDACGSNGWPADLDPNNALSIGDFNSFIFPNGTDDSHGVFAYYGHPVPDAGRVNEERWDLDPNGVIDIGDINALNPGVTASTARPPMFGGQAAFFAGACPWPP
jgi:hypothetical protein